MQPCRYVFQCKQSWLRKMINMSSLRVSNYCPSTSRYLWLQLTYLVYIGAPSCEGYPTRTVPLSFTSRGLNTIYLNTFVLLSSACGANGMLATHHTRKTWSFITIVRVVQFTHVQYKHASVNRFHRLLLIIIGVLPYGRYVSIYVQYKHASVNNFRRCKIFVFSIL